MGTRRPALSPSYPHPNIRTRTMNATELLRSGATLATKLNPTIQSTGVTFSRMFCGGCTVFIIFAVVIAKTVFQRGYEDAPGEASDASRRSPPPRF